MSGGVAGGGSGIAGVGTLAARPAAGVAGRAYYATDTALFYVEDGATWHTVGPSSFTGSSSPRGYRSGLLPRRTGDNTLNLIAGRARSSDQTTDIVLATAAAIDITAAGDGGFDHVVLAAGAVTHGTTAFETTANAFSNYEIPIDGPGTITTVGTALTLAGGSFTQPDTENRLGPVAVGDLVGNTSKGYARVASIDGATTATLEVALPNGDATAAAWKYFERPAVALGAVATDRREIKSIGGDGTSLTAFVVMGAALTSNAAGGADLTIGSLADGVLRPYYTWVAQTTPGGATVKFVSTSRTTPKIAVLVGALAGYRRLAAVWVDTANKLVQMTWSDLAPNLARARFEVQYATQGTRVVSNVAAAAWTRAVASGCVPPTSRAAWAALQGTTAGDIISVREASTGEAATSRAFLAQHAGALNHIATGLPGPINLDAAQAFDFVINGAGNLYVDVAGYEEIL